MKSKLRKTDKNQHTVTSAGTILKNKVFQVVVLAVVIFIVFSGTIGNGFVWDDDDYIHKNPLLTEPGGLAKIWKSYYSPKFNPQQNTPQYYPLVFTTFYLEHKLWGFHPSGLPYYKCHFAYRQHDSVAARAAKTGPRLDYLADYRSAFSEFIRHRSNRSHGRRNAKTFWRGFFISARF